MKAWDSPLKDFATRNREIQTSQYIPMKYILNTDYLRHDGLEGLVLVGVRNISQGLLEMFERNDRKVQTILKSAT